MVRLVRRLFTYLPTVGVLAYQDVCSVLDVDCRFEPQVTGNVKITSTSRVVSPAGDHVPSDPRQGLAVVGPFWRCGGSFCGVMASGDITAPGPSSFHLPLLRSVLVPLHADMLNRTKRGEMASPRPSIMAEVAKAAYHPGRTRGGRRMRLANCQPASPPSARPVSQIRLPLS